jgi:hypothetical protein
MPERWESELRRLRTVGPSSDVWERATQGPSRPQAPDRTGRDKRLLAGAVAVVVLIAAGLATWRAFAPRGALIPPAGPSETPAGFFLIPSDTLVSLKGTSGVTMTVVFDTNLQDGTIAEMRFDTAAGGGGVGGGGVNSVVDGGTLRVAVEEPVCNDVGTGFDLTVEIRPFYEDFVVPGYPQGSPWPPTQSNAVLQALGDHFQNLTGDQVTTTDSSQGLIKQIVVTGSYDWPPPPSGFIPPPCPTPVPSP